MAVERELSPRSMADVSRTSLTTAAFREILATGRPWDPASVQDLGIDVASVRAAIHHLVEAGRVVTLEEGTDLGVVEWRPLVEGHPWAHEGPGSRDPAGEGAR